MFVFHQFEHLLARRTITGFNSSQESSRVPSRTLLNFNSLSHSIYNNFDQPQYCISPKKNQIYKCKDLRKKLISRGTQRPRKLSLCKNKVREEENENNELVFNTLLCTKAVVHECLDIQESSIKRTLKLRQELTLKTKSDDNGVSSFFHRPRRFSQHVESLPVSPTKRIITENLRIKVTRKLSETTSSSLFDSQVIKVRNSLNFMKKPVKQSSNSYVVKATRMDKEPSQQIDAWNCEDGFVDDLEF